MSSLHESPPMSASYLKRTVSKAWRQIHFFFSCLCHSCSLRQLGWETNFLAVRKEKKIRNRSTSEQAASRPFWAPVTACIAGLSGGGWRPQPLQQLGSAPKCAGLQLPAGEREIFRGICLLQSLDRAIGCLHQLEICPEMEERGNWSKKRAVKKTTHASDCSGKIINI